MIELPYVLAGAVTGFVVGLTGVGGGALMTPILLIVFGVSPVTAIATDLWFAFITKIIGARVHHASGNVDWQVVKRLWLGSLPAACVIVLLISQSGETAQFEWLTKAIGYLVLITALGLLLAPWLTAVARRRRLTKPGPFLAMQTSLTVFSGGMLGVCVSLTSVGAGALGSVMLLYLYPLRMTPHRLVATDIVHAIPLAAVAGLGYLFAGLVDWSMLWNLLLGSVPAVILGSLLAGKLPVTGVRIALALVLMLAALKTLSI